MRGKPGVGGAARNGVCLFLLLGFGPTTCASRKLMQTTAAPATSDPPHMSFPYGTFYINRPPTQAPTSDFVDPLLTPTWPGPGSVASTPEGGGGTYDINPAPAGEGDAAPHAAYMTPGTVGSVDGQTPETADPVTPTAPALPQLGQVGSGYAAPSPEVPPTSVPDDASPDTLVGPGVASSSTNPHGKHAPLVVGMLCIMVAVLALGVYAVTARFPGGYTSLPETCPENEENACTGTTRAHNTDVELQEKKYADYGSVSAPTYASSPLVSGNCLQGRI
mmetsp:Transcript_1915/g.3947  ORF Transcript_1915/g.3947 Transcript_1915/m.3947 type:complete len:277 (+) Transcript_1915:446-1276(+)